MGKVEKKYDISVEQYTEKRLECEEALAVYDYSKARRILEQVLLASDITVDGIVPSVTFDMIMDYALCLTNGREFEEARKLVNVAQKFLYIEHIKEGSYMPSEESLMKMWKKVCIIYASCPGTSPLLDNAISSMLEQKVELDGKFYWNIAKKCRYSGNYDMAFQLLEMALTLANKTNDVTLEQKINDEREKTSEMAKAFKRKTFESFIDEGGELKTGMIIGVRVNGIPKEKNSLLPEKMPETLPFLIWEVTPKYVYAFPIRIARKRDLEFQEPIKISGYTKVLKEAIYRLPIDKKTILNVQAILDDITLNNVFKKMYHSIAKLYTSPNANESVELNKYFVRKITEQCIAEPGDRLIIGKGYYYVESVDTTNKEYVVVPITYACNIKIPLRFRIPFKHSCIFAVVDTSEEDKIKMKERLSEGLESSYINTFCKYGNKTYLITGEDGDSYICLDIYNQLSNGSQETLYLPKKEVNLHNTCMGLNLNDCFWQYHKLTTLEKKRGRIVKTLNNDK